MQTSASLPFPSVPRLFPARGERLTARWRPARPFPRPEPGTLLIVLALCFLYLGLGTCLLGGLRLAAAREAAQAAEAPVQAARR